MARDPAIDQPLVATAQSAEAGKPNEADPAAAATAPPGTYGDGEDAGYWIACMEDAERAEKDWRKRGREVIEIYRNQSKAARSEAIQLGKINFNILYANTEVMLPAIYSKPPEPVVRSRFVKLAPPMPPQPPMPPPGMMPPGAPPAGPVPPQAGPPAPLGPPGAGMPPGAMGAPVSPVPPGPALVPPPGAPPPSPLLPGPQGPAPGPMGGMLGQGPDMPAPPPGLPRPAPGRPDQEDIEAAASVMQAALKIVVEDENSNEACKAAVKDVLLPGRGVCRVRWRPQMEQRPVMAGDGTTPLLGDDGQPQQQDVKVWEEVGDEYVYWEDLLVDPVRNVADMNWIAFRHLFTKEALDEEFADSPEYQKLVQQAKTDTILRWTDESAAKSPVGGGSAIRTTDTLGGHIRKAMVWEIWDRRARRILWFIRDGGGVVLRADPDSYQLMGFYPIPAPMLAVSTTDTRVPRCYYDLYAQLAADLDDCSKNIARLIKQIKVRGAYNSASREIADILLAADGKMIPVDGVDMANGGLQNHLWMVPIDPWAAALDKLMVAKEHLKQSIYEIMGISDIMRGATRASETATAQRIKGSMGVSRLEDAKSTAANFARDLLRLKAEIIGQNFSPETLEAMTGEEVTPGVMEILRSDFQRICAIDIETDSTVAVDEQAEQQSMAQVMTAIQGVMMGTQSMLQVQFLPPIQVMQLSMELLKMFLHPIRYSRPVVAMLNDLQEQLRMMAMMPPPPPAPMPVAGPGAPPGGPAPGPQPAPSEPPGMTGRPPDLQPLAA